MQLGRMVLCSGEGGMEEYTKIPQNRTCTRLFPLFHNAFAQSGSQAWKHALQITGVYFVIGCLWILLSDKLVEMLFINRESVILVSMIKGWFYVFISAALIYGLVFKAMKNELHTKEKLKAANSELQESNTLFSAILESSPEIIVFSLDSKYRYTAFNSRHRSCMLQLWGSDIRLGMYMPDAISVWQDSQQAKKNFDRALSGESFTVTEELGNEALSRLYWQNYYAPIYNGEHAIVGVTCFALNVTAQKRTEDENLFLSWHDKLTGLYNRRYFEDALSSLDRERQYPVSVIIGDVDGLKLVNDAFGHGTGDELLKIAAEVVGSVCRPGDIAARWGGDEFIMLLPQTDAEEARRLSYKIKQESAQRQFLSMNADVSLGWATKTGPEQDIMQIIKIAEDMMFQSKVIESKSMRSHMIKVIMNTLHEKNPREEAHSRRVGEISRKIGAALGLSEVEANTLSLAGYLHDIGKIAVDEGILNKPDSLTEEELDCIRDHPEIGFRIIRSSYEISEIADAILSHHERWDGRGYPKGLAGEYIPLYARIIAVADSYDAMTAQRPYKNCLTADEAAREIFLNAGRQFDPAISRLFYEKVLGLHWPA